MSRQTRWLEFRDRESGCIFLYPREQAIDQAMMEPADPPPNHWWTVAWLMFFVLTAIGPFVLYFFGR